MKKFLLSALSIVTILSASASIEGTYTMKKYVGHEMTGYKFAGGETWTSEDEDAEPWDFIIEKTSEGYSITNLLDWEETIEATYDEETGILSIQGGTEIMEGYAILGGLGTSTLTAQAIMDACDKYSSYVPDWTKQPVKLKAEEGRIVATTPILIYSASSNYSGYIGYAYDIMSEFEAEKTAPATPEDTISGTYYANVYEGHELSSAYKFAGGETWTNLDEDAEPWEVYVEKTSEGYSITNLLDWEENIEATYDEETGILSIQGGTEIMEGYAILGGLGSSTLTAQAIMDACDKYSSYVPDWTKQPVKLKAEEGRIVATTPILIYSASSNYSGYIGYAYDLISVLELGKEKSSVNAIVNDNTDGPVEYFNLQGIRVVNPISGQLLIKRQGSNVSKVIIR